MIICSVFVYIYFFFYEFVIIRLIDKIRGIVKIWFIEWGVYVKINGFYVDKFIIGIVFWVCIVFNVGG